MENTVKLISMTQGVDGMSAEDIVAYTARVSNPSTQNQFETAPKLIAYLIRNKHWSPFEMVNVTIEIVTSRAIAAQILRHRSFVYQEFSQRYSEVTNNIYYEARRQDVKNRQNSIDDMSSDVKDWFSEAQLKVWDSASTLYKEALQKGIAKEQARFLLPLSTQTKLYMNGSIRSWLHYVDLRSANGTQKEHRDIALACKDIFLKHFPNISEAMGWKSE